MKQYYISDGQEKSGPFTIEELSAKKINPNTLVWTQGMDNWQEAGSIEELKQAIVSQVPPPIPNRSNPDVSKGIKPEKRQKSLAGYYIVGIIALAAALIFIVVNNSNKNGSHKNDTTTQNLLGDIITPQIKEQEKTPEELKIDLREKEKVDFLRYLNVYYELLPTLGGRARIKGNVTNSATMLSVKDVVIRMSFYTKTETFLGSENKTIYEYINSKGSKYFDWRIRTPDKTSYINLEVIDAEVVE